MFNKKVYNKKYMQTYLQTEKGFLTKQFARFNERKKIGFAFTKKDFFAWTYTDFTFRKLFIEWVASGCQKELKPSVDRIDDFKPYTFDNMQWLTWKDNWRKGVNGTKNIQQAIKNLNHKSKQHIVIQYNKHRVVGIYQTLKECCDKNPHFQKSKICLVAKGKRPHHHGFSFMYVMGGEFCHD